MAASQLRCAARSTGQTTLEAVVVRLGVNFDPFVLFALQIAIMRGREGSAGGEGFNQCGNKLK